MNDEEAAVPDEIKTAMRGEVRLSIVPTFTHGDSVRVEGKVGGRWKRIGPLIFPPDDGSLTDVLSVLASFREPAAVTS